MCLQISFKAYSRNIHLYIKIIAWSIYLFKQQNSVFNLYTNIQSICPKTLYEENITAESHIIDFWSQKTCRWYLQAKSRSRVCIALTVFIMIPVLNYNQRYQKIKFIWDEVGFFFYLRKKNYKPSEGNMKLTYLPLKLPYFKCSRKMKQL